MNTKLIRSLFSFVIIYLILYLVWFEEVSIFVLRIIMIPYSFIATTPNMKWIFMLPKLLTNDVTTNPHITQVLQFNNFHKIGNNFDG